MFDDGPPAAVREAALGGCGCGCCDPAPPSDDELAALLAGDPDRDLPAAERAAEEASRWRQEPPDDRELDQPGPPDVLDLADRLPPDAADATASAATVAEMAAPGAPGEPPDRLAGLLEVPVGPQVLQALQAAEAGGLTPAEDVSAWRLWDRAAAWVSAQGCRALVRLVPDRPPTPSSGRWSAAELSAVAGHESARMEAACAVRWSAGQARWRVAQAQLLADRPVVLDRLQAGAISAEHAHVVVAGLGELGPEVPVEVVAGVEAAALDVAERSSVRATRDRLRRSVLAVDAGAAERRHAAERDRRRVWLTALPDGMAEVGARLAAQDAVAVFDVVAQAAGRRAPVGDDRSADQRRADTFVQLLCDPDAASTPDADPESGAAAAADAAAGVDGLAAGAGRPRRQRQRRLVGVVVAASTLTGADDAPGELAGYGPVSAQQARRLAAEGDLFRLLVDPVEGRLLDRGRTTYRAPAALEEFVRARDRACTGPFCGVDAARTELDHDTKWRPGADTEDGGDTDAANLRCRCPVEHRVKDHGDWSVVHHDDGSATWTSARGQSYTAEPGSYRDFLPPTWTLEDLPPPDTPVGQASRPRPAPAPPPDDPDEPPPF